MRNYVLGLLTGLVVALLFFWWLDERVARLDARVKFIEGYLTTSLNTDAFLNWRKTVEGPK